MKWFWKPKVNQPVPDLTTSILYDEGIFYKKFIQDTSEAREEVIIESPFITKLRMQNAEAYFLKAS